MLGTVNLAVGNLSDRRFQLFAVSTSYPDDSQSTDLYSRWKPTTEPGESWTGWERWIGQFPTGGPYDASGTLKAAYRAAAIQTFDNRLLVLVLGPGGQVFLTVKLNTNPDAGWLDWTQWNSLQYEDLAAARLIGRDTSQGRALQGVGGAQIFGVTPRGTIETFWQVQNTDDASQFFSWWTTPQDFSIPPSPSTGQVSVKQITTAQLWSGQIQVWAVDQNGSLWSNWKDFDPANPQDLSTGWVGWQQFSQPRFPVTQISSSRLSDGTVQLFALSPSAVNSIPPKSQIWSSWQQSANVDAGWTPWSEFQQPMNGNEPVPLTWTAAGLSASDRTQLWALSELGDIWTCWDNGVGTGWSGWTGMPGNPP